MRFLFCDDLLPLFNLAEEKETYMKQFLYLDTDIVNSIIAQAEKGLITSSSTEKDFSETEGDALASEVHADGKVGGSLFKLVQAEAEIVGKISAAENGSTTYGSREIVAKTLHDAAFDLAYAQVSPNAVLPGDCSHSETGEYIQLTRVFDFVDFDYLEGLFAANGIIDLIKKSEAEKIEEEAERVKAQTSREQLRKSGVNFKAEVKKIVGANSKQYDDIAGIIKGLRSLIPYSRMLISNDGYLIPLSDKYFRVDGATIGFNYGGEITCVGMITNIIGEDCDPCDENNIFATIQHASNEILRSMLPTKEKNLCVIHPIGIYYGK
jgi:hypothetical protein